MYGTEFYEIKDFLKLIFNQIQQNTIQLSFKTKRFKIKLVL